MPAESEPQHEEPEVRHEEPSPVPTPQEPEYERESSPVESAHYEQSPRGEYNGLRHIMFIEFSITCSITLWRKGSL